MSTRRLMTCAVVLIVLVVWNVRLATGATPIVVITGKTVTTLCLTCATHAVHVSVTTRDDVKVQPLISKDAVTVDGTLDKDLLEAFQVEWAEKDARPRAFDVTLTRVPPRAAAYELTLTVTSAETSERLQLSLTINRPAGRLSPPGTIHVDRTTWLPGLFALAAPKLKLVEMSQRSEVAVSIQSSKTSVMGGTDVTGELTFEPATVPAGKSADVSYSLAGDFPFGTTAGAASIQSDQLAEPVAVAYEVRTHLAAILYIPIAIAVGLWVSWLVKVQWQASIDLETARVRADRLLGDVVTITQRHQDRTLGHDIADAMNALAAARGRDDPSDIEAKRTVLDAALQTAVKSLTDRRQEVVANLQALRNFVAMRWQAPPRVAQVVRDVEGALDDVARRLDVDNVSDAAAALDDIRVKTSASIATETATWVACVRTALRAVGDRRGVSEAGQALVHDLKTTLDASLAAAETIPRDVQYALLKDGMQHVTAAYVQTRQLFDGLSEGVKNDAARAIDVLSRKETKNPAVVAALVRQAQEVRGLLNAVVDQCDPESPVSASLDALDDAWREALLAQLEQAQQADVLQNLDARRYKEAAEAAAKVLPDARPAQPMRLQRAAVDVVGDGSRTASIQDKVDAPKLPVGVTSPNWIPSAALSFDSARALKEAKTRQTLLLGALMCVFGYGVYEPKFIGTMSDLSSIVFWAFGVDLSVETVLKLTKK